MSDIRQPWLGVAASAAVIVTSVLAMLPLSYATLGGVVADVMMCTIPFTAVVSSFWQGRQPRAIAELRQPLRGFAFLGLAAVVAVVVYWCLQATIGGGQGATPVLAFGTIGSVVVTFVLVAAWGGWPFTLIPNPLLGGATLLVTAYVVTGLLLQVLDFSFLGGAFPGLDPAGPLPAWDGLVAAVTSLATLFAFLHLELWPFRRSPALLRQPVLGLVWTPAVLAIGCGLYYAGTRWLGLSPDTFLVSVPVPFMFGTVILLTMLEGSATARLHGLRRGFASLALAAVLGTLLARCFALLQPLLTPDVPANSLDQHLWLASALLAVTFPLLAMHHDFFGFWPLRAAPVPEREPDVEVAAPADR